MVSCGATVTRDRTEITNAIFLNNYRVDKWLSREAHILKIEGSNPSPVTNL